MSKNKPEAYDTEDTDPNYLPPNKAKSRYEALAALREPFLQRARSASAVTLPTLIPPDGHTESTEYPTPEQSFGALAVNNLASKLTEVLLPPDSPFFKFEAERPEGIDNQAWGQIESEFDVAFSGLERTIMNSVDSRMIRTDTVEMCKHLVVAGNVALKVPLEKRKRITVYPLSSYVVQRDPSGEILCMIFKESIAYEAIPLDVREACKITAPASACRLKYFDLYTIVQSQPRETETSPYTYSEYQEINGYEIPNTAKDYTEDTGFPYLCLRYESVSGEHYGRGLVEQYQGDFIFLEGMAIAMKDSAAICSQIRFLVNPNGNTSVRELKRSRNGDFVPGRPEDVQALQVLKQSDMAWAASQIKEKEQRLSAAFLLNIALRRDAERVTAYEISVMQKEVETALGGTYSSLSQDFQEPMLSLLFMAEQKAGTIPKELKFNEENLVIKIIGGLTGLGRGSDLQRYDMFLSQMAKFVPQEFAQRLKFDELSKRIASSLGISAAGLIKTDEEIQQEMQQAAMMGAAQQAAPDLIAQAAQQQQPNQGETV